MRRQGYLCAKRMLLLFIGPMFLVLMPLGKSYAQTAAAILAAYQYLNDPSKVGSLSCGLHLGENQCRSLDRCERNLSIIAYLKQNPSSETAASDLDKKYRSSSMNRNCIKSLLGGNAGAIIKNVRVLAKAGQERINASLTGKGIEAPQITISPRVAECGGGFVEVLDSGDKAIFIDKNGIEELVYDGRYQIRRVASCNSGVLTAFDFGKHDEVYYSPNCRHIGKVGADSQTEVVYNGSYKVRRFEPLSAGVATYFEGLNQRYVSSNCRDIGR